MRGIKMKALILTVAGMSTRFSQSVGYECIKCIYHENDIKTCILSRLLQSNQKYCDIVIVVGGFKFDELNQCIDREFIEEYDILTVKNEHYFDYGSNYSLLLGLEKAFELGADEIVFSEGDLYVNPDDFKKIWCDDRDVITANFMPIDASKSVAFYYDIKSQVHYIFDSSHETFEINESFTTIRNSGQIWKFKNINRLKEICINLTEKEKQQGTNLIIIQKYFGQKKRETYSLIDISNWINCNTVDDFRSILE